jgi:hypothetical protein
VKRDFSSQFRPTAAGDQLRRSAEDVSILHGTDFRVKGRIATPIPTGASAARESRKK